MAKTIKKNEAPQIPVAAADFQQLFKKLLGNKDFAHQFFDVFPLPIEIFIPDGTSVFVNRSYLKWYNIPDAGLAAGKYNILKDPAIMEKKGLRNIVLNAFKGETVCAFFASPALNPAPGVKAGNVPGKPSPAEVYFYTVRDNDKCSFVIVVWNTSMPV